MIQFITMSKGVDRNKPLDKAYRLFESVVWREEHEEETTMLLKNQHTTFSASYNNISKIQWDT